MTQHKGTGGYSPRSPKSHEPQTHMTIVRSALPSLELTVSGCKQNFVCWPFKMLCVSLANSYLSGREKPSCFSQLDVTWAPLPSSGVLDWGAQLQL